MFDEIGRKIKVLAKVVLGVGIAASLILAIVFAKQAEEVSYRYEDTYRMFAFISIIVGPLVSYISSMFTYGFGELIEQTAETAKNTRSIGVKPLGDTEVKKHTWKCESCKQYTDTYPCSHCGYEPNADKKDTLNDLLENNLICKDEYDQIMKQ